MGRECKPRSVCFNLGCPPTNNRVEKVGAFPWLVMPVHNNEQLIFYVDILFPGGVNPRRAWLLPPAAEGDKATVTLETTRMNLGLGAPAPRVALETSLAPVGDWVYPTMGCYLLTDSVTGTYALGVTADADGYLTASTPSKTIDPPTAAAFQFLPNTTILRAPAFPRPCCSTGFSGQLVIGGIPNPNAPLRTGIRLDAFSPDGRELRAIPVPRTRRNQSLPALSNYGNDFYLAWKDPADTGAGFPAVVMFVSELATIPCNRQLEISGPGIIRNPPILRDPPFNRSRLSQAVDGRGAGLFDPPVGSVGPNLDFVDPPVTTPALLGVSPLATSPYQPCCCDCTNDIPARVVCRDSVRRRSAFAGEPGYFNYHV